MKHGIFFQIKDNLIAQGVCKSAEEFTPEWAQLINLVITQANDENPFQIRQAQGLHIWQRFQKPK